MLKFTNHLANANLLLIKRQVGEGTCAAFVVMRSPVRRYAKEFYSEKCPPPDKPPKSRKFLYGMIGATVLTGAAIVYAKNSPEARAYIETHAPWANNIIAVVYQENTTHWQFTVNQLSKAKNAIVDFMFGKEGVTPMDFKQRSEQNLEQDAKIIFQDNKDYELPPPVLEPLYVEETVIETPDVDPPSNVIRTDKCEPQKPIEIKITKDIVELEQEMHEFTKKAIDQYKRALVVCAKYTKAVNDIMEMSVDELEKKHFFALQGARSERDKLLASSKEASAKAKCAIETLERALNSGLKAPPENIAITRRYIKQFGDDIAAIEKQVKEELEKAVLYDRFRDKVEAARKAYNEELEALFPGVDLKARQIDIRGDTDLLLLYTMKQIQYLQKELAEAQTIRETKLNRAIECKDEKAIIEMKVEDMVRKERLQKEAEYQKKLLLAEAEAYRKMKETLKKQMDINLEVLQSRIAAKEKEIMARIGRVVSEEVEKERTKFKQELAAMVGKLQAIEQTLKTRAKAEAEARKSQTLWLAAEALLAATRKQQCQTKIDNELTALEKAAGKDDKLVTTILDGIPKDVREKGIATEICLKERFDKLEQTAKKVALIGREGAALPMYFLSWLQSKLLFQKLAEIPKDELDNLPMDFTELDTFDIIHRARYHMDHGNLAHAMRYVNLLQGAPRAAACAWLEAARMHLEIRQAAEAVMAHAALSGMLK